MRTTLLLCQYTICTSINIINKIIKIKVGNLKLGRKSIQKLCLNCFKTD